jgi:hypothetical protein
VANVFQKVPFKDFKEENVPGSLAKKASTGTIATSPSKGGLVRSKSGNNLPQVSQDTIRAVSPTPSIARTGSGKLR